MSVNSRTGSIPSACVRFSGLEVYARIMTICEVLAIVENTRAQSNDKTPATFRALIKGLCEHFQIDQTLTALMPQEAVFKTPIETRSQQSAGCFRDAHTRLLDARESLLPWLLLKTYSDHPPVAVEAYNYLRLGDIKEVLDKLAYTLRYGARYIDRDDHYDRSSYMEDQKKQVEFLLDQLMQYEINADTYAQAVQQYVQLLDSVFPAAIRANAAAGDVTVTVSGLPAIAG
jgi:hypothetical protein